MALDNTEFNKNRVTLDMIEVQNGKNFLISGEEKEIKVDDENSIIKADHFNATKKLNIIFSSILFLGLLFLINKFKQ